MRFVRCVFFLSLLVVVNGISQQFHRSEGLNLFNRGQYQAAADSMLHWADAFTSERGIAYYYVGESYYNLGLEDVVSSRSIRYFRDAVQHFDRATKQTDLVTLYPSKISEARYKKAWCYYRLSELESDPVPSLKLAYEGFMDLASAGRDSLSVVSLYMAGDCRLRTAEWQRVQMLLSANEAQAVESAREAIQGLDDAEDIFRRVADSDGVSHHLRTCARFRRQDVLFVLGKLYARISAAVLAGVQDVRREGTPGETATDAFLRTDYGSVLSSVDRLTQVEFEPGVTYSEAVKYLNLYLLTGGDEDKQRLNVYLDSLRWSGFQSEKFFLQGSRDLREDAEDEPFQRLAGSQMSFYAKVAEDFPEARYWLGWAQFVANIEESEDQFNRFLSDTEGVSVDPRFVALREDARYRTFLLRFDHHAADRSYLRRLREDVERFRPQIPAVRERTRLLLQLIRVGLGEPIWGRILEAPTTENRLRDAFILIQNMLVRAARVTGKERVPYLEYLNRLFQITRHRRTEETAFYRGLSLFLRAEIQETANNKRRFYSSAADTLKLAKGHYAYEGMYVQARSYFAAAKHESQPDQRRRAYERARPIFIELINDVRSLRSVYYLGEIFRIQGNDMAARRCYEIVIRRTEGQAGGEFWYNNALAGKQSCQEALGDTTVLRGIGIDDVVFPERLLVVDGEVLSLERFADPEYIRRQYGNEAIDLLLKFGLPKRTLYPSVFRLSSSRFDRRAFRTTTAGIRERIGMVTSGLRLELVFPQDVPHGAVVTLDGVPLERDVRGGYQKVPLPLNQTMEIRVANTFCYPFVKRHRFTNPGVERLVVSLIRRIVFESRGVGGESEVSIVRFSQRLDGNVVLYPVGSPLSQATFLYRDFQENIAYRDFAYSEILDGYLVVNSEMENLLFYRNDAMVSKEGTFPLVLPAGEETVSSPEGIAVDSRGNIYVMDWGNHRVLVFRSDGAYLRSLGSFGRNVSADVGKPVHFVFPTRIALVEDSEGVLVNGRRVYRDPYIFVADRYGIQFVDVNGSYLDTFVPPGMAAGSLYGLTVRGYDSNLLLYVMDRKTGDVERFVAKPAAVE